MTSHLSAIARYTVLEAWRTRLLLAAALALALVFAASAFVRELALVQDERMQTAFYAATARVAAVFIVALHVVGSLAREFADKGPDAVLALNIARWRYLVGKAAGYGVLCAIVAGLAALPLLVLADAPRVAVWFASLALEASIIAALAVFCVVTFSHVTPAMAFVAGFYILCRGITGLTLVALHPIAGEGTAMHEGMAWAVRAIGLLLPRLDTWTRTAWLIDDPAAAGELGHLALQAAVYVALLIAATLVDFYRRNV